jgi:hypothetical protein
MTVLSFYRVLLLLYPADFRHEFAEEMLLVFEQIAGEQLVAASKIERTAFLISELTGIAKGAYTMWMKKRVAAVEFTSISSNEASLTVEQLAARRTEAIEHMVIAIAKHDFINARRYSEEEGRIERRLKEISAKVQIKGTHSA